MKISRIAALTLALPLSLSAQGGGGAPQGPPPGGPTTGMYRTRTMNLQRNLAQAFDSVPESKFSYKPTPAQLSIGYIAMHLANDNYFFCNNFGDKKGTRTPEETSTPDSVKATWPKAKLVEQLKASFAFCEDAFTQLDDAKIAEMITVAGPNNTTRQALRANYVFGHAMDMQDHYSQMANYMRINGMLPPTALPRPPARP